MTKTLFGPVPSRRFGRSLGIDLVPLKTCSFDCLFCQLGRTTVKTLDRKVYVPLHTVFNDLGHWLQSGDRADVLTLSGSGEPTLHSQFGQILTYIAANSSIPSLILTNGSLLGLPEVRQAAGQADMVKTSLCAWDQASFVRINRPHRDLCFDSFWQGQLRFREEYSGTLILEVFLLHGLNDHPEHIQALATLARDLAPDRIHLNTVERPPAEAVARPVPADTLEAARREFTPQAEIATLATACISEPGQTTEAAILETVQRRPCTLADLSAIYGLHQNEIAKYVSHLVHKGLLQWTHSPAGEPYLTRPEEM